MLLCSLLGVRGSIKLLGKIAMEKVNYLEDKVVWARVEDGRFIVKWLYNAMVGDVIDSFFQR